MIELREGVELAPYTTFKVGGPAKKFVIVKNIEELQEALTLAMQNKWPVFILAGGSNIIVSSKGFDGLVIKIEILSKIVSNNRIISGSGAMMSDLVSMATTQGLSGLEWAGGLPGTLGGAVRGNAGCFGSEIKDIIDMVISVDRTSGQVISRSARQCQFSYRSSIFKEKDNEVIVSISLKLGKGDPGKLQKIAQEHIDYRLKKHPMEYPSAGSVFKNVPVSAAPDDVAEKYKSYIKSDPFPIIPAGKLIADAGLAGLKEGGAEVSDKHSNYIVNKKNAKPEEIVTLIKAVRKAVREKFGIVLEVEQHIVGF